MYNQALHSWMPRGNYTPFILPTRYVLLLPHTAIRPGILTCDLPLNEISNGSDPQVLHKCEW